MRASNLSLVIVTGYYLLWTVRAQISQTTEASHEPTNITVSPTTWIANEPFTVNWRDDTANCFIARVNLVEMDLGDVRFVILRK
jgi:hypothetical protein